MLLQNGTNFLSDDYRRSRIHEPEFCRGDPVSCGTWSSSIGSRQIPTTLQSFNASIPEGSGYHGPFAWQRAAMMNLGLGQSGSLGFAGTGKNYLSKRCSSSMVQPTARYLAVGRVVEMWGSTEVPDEAWEVMKFPLVDHEVQVGVFTILRDGLPANTNTWDDARLLEKERSSAA